MKKNLLMAILLLIFIPIILNDELALKSLLVNEEEDLDPFVGSPF